MKNKINYRLIMLIMVIFILFLTTSLIGIYLNQVNQVKIKNSFISSSKISSINTLGMKKLILKECGVQFLLPESIHSDPKIMQTVETVSSSGSRKNTVVFSNQTKMECSQIPSKEKSTSEELAILNLFDSCDISIFSGTKNSSQYKIETESSYGGWKISNLPDLKKCYVTKQTSFSKENSTVSFYKINDKNYGLTFIAKEVSVGDKSTSDTVDVKNIKIYSLSENFDIPELKISNFFDYDNNSPKK